MAAFDKIDLVGMKQMLRTSHKLLGKKQHPMKVRGLGRASQAEMAKKQWRTSSWSRNREVNMPHEL